MEPVKFNVFQRVLRDWDALHPYNAAQVLHLRGEADIDLLTDRWNQTLCALGVGAVHVEGRRFWIDRPNHAGQALCVPEMSLEEFMTEEMNRPFAPKMVDNCFRRGSAFGATICSHRAAALGPQAVDPQRPFQ